MFARAFVLALSLHILLLAAISLAPLKPTSPPVWIELDQLEPQSQTGRIHIQKDSSPVKDSPAPEKSRSISDRNRVVRQEMRARPSVGLERLGVLNHLKGQTSGELAPFSAKQELAQAAKRERESAGLAGLDDPTLPEGAETLLNTRQSVFYTFYSRLYESIAPLWLGRVRQAYGLNRKPLTGRYTTRVAVILDRLGNFQGIRILESSSIPAFDQTVLDSWGRVRQFPNPPKGLVDPEGKVVTFWNFTVEVGDGGSSWNFLPPRRI